jgi:hypothetical protein
VTGSFEYTEDRQNPEELSPSNESNSEGKLQNNEINGTRITRRSTTLN